MAPTSIAEISRPDLESLETVAAAAASITDVKHLSSYNWIEASTPTIAVPGSPPLWSPPTKGPQKLAKDSGLIYIAQNAVRHPESPLKPLFRALYMSDPSFDMRSVDLVTDRNNIRKLLSFVNPGLSRGGLEPFTIDVEVLDNSNNNKTAVFCRAETETLGLSNLMNSGVLVMSLRRHIRRTRWKAVRDITELSRTGSVT